MPTWSSEVSVDTFNVKLEDKAVMDKIEVIFCREIDVQIVRALYSEW